MKAKNMMIQNLCNAAKAVLRGKFIAIPQDTRKVPNNQTNLTPRQRQLEKQEQKIKLKVNRKKKLRIRGRDQ